MYKHVGGLVNISAQENTLKKKKKFYSASYDVK